MSTVDDVSIHHGPEVAVNAPAVTLDEIKTWPPTVDVARAGRALGISRSYAFELAKRNELPCRVLRVGNRYRVPTSSLLALLEPQPVSESA